MNNPIPATAAVATGSTVTPAQAAHALLSDARFLDLVKRRRAFAWALTILMLAIYFAFILTIAFSPRLLGHPIVGGLPMTWGIPVGFGMFFVTFGLVAVCVFQANSVHDGMVADIRQGGHS